VRKSLPESRHRRNRGKVWLSQFEGVLFLTRHGAARFRRVPNRPCPASFHWARHPSDQFPGLRQEPQVRLLYLLISCLEERRTPGAGEGDRDHADVHCVDAQRGPRYRARFNRSRHRARLSTFSLHFMEVTSAGSIKVTTVFNQESRPASSKPLTQHDYLGCPIPGFESEPPCPRTTANANSVRSER